jgi:MATE family multidrug resistance protein
MTVAACRATPQVKDAVLAKPQSVDGIPTDVRNPAADSHAPLSNASMEEVSPEQLVNTTSSPREAERQTSLPDHLSSAGAHRAVILLAWPVLLEQVLHFSVGFFDVYLSGRLGQEETAAIGMAAYVSWLGSMIFGLVGVGATALIARFWGAHQFDEARMIISRAMALAICLGIAVSSVLFSMAPGIVWLLGLSGASVNIGITYLRIDAIGQIFSAWVLVGAASLRGAGDMRTPLYVLCLTSVVNIVLSTTFVYGLGPVPTLGVNGIVYGTVCAQFSGALLMAWFLTSGRTVLQIVYKEFLIRRESTWRLMRIGGPAALDGVATFTGHFLFLMIIARLTNGEAAFAAHIVGVRVEALSYLPAVAFGIASGSLAGRYLGAQRPDLARACGFAAVGQAVAYAAVMSVLFFTFAPQIYAQMHIDPLVQTIGVDPFRLMACYQIPNAILIVLVSTLRGSGDTRFPLWCAFLGTFFIRVPLAWYLGIGLNYGLFGAWIGMGADNILRCGLISWRYLAGRWIHVKV